MTPVRNLIIRHARVLTMGGHAGARRGEALASLCPVDDAWIHIQNGTIVDLGPEHLGPPPDDPDALDVSAGGRVVMPGFIDCHTHACWAGNRLDEWDQKRAGVPYLEILKRGGGIMSTVRAVRAARDSHGPSLEEQLRDRLFAMRAEGTTTVEVKTGYGLDALTEIEMLMAISGCGSHGALPTALLGHAIDPDVERSLFLDEMMGTVLSLFASKFPGICIDAFCESGAWTLEECIELFTRAKALGCSFRVHADQFNALGMTEWAVDHGAVSVDHLEASTESGLKKLANSDTFGVMLPACGFHLDGRYANGRAFVDMGGALALATNLNPGSAPCFSMPFVIALAVRHLGLSPFEAIAATTVNPAALLGLTDRGWIGPGARADLIVLRHTDERNLAFEFGGNHVHEVIRGGNPLRRLSMMNI